MQKSMLSVDGEDIKIAFNFTKVDKTNRTVTGVATADNVDSEGDVIEYEASKEAFSKWLGNIREMHGPKAVGKAVKVDEVDVQDSAGNIYKGFKVTAYISKGANDTWEKCLDGTLTGFSVGGRVLKKSREFHKGMGTMVSRISKYALTELSVVDNPANPLAEFSMVKMNSQGTLELTKNTSVEGSVVFYCDTDEIAKFDDSTCTACGTIMNEIGYVESINAEEITKMIDNYELNKNFVQGVGTWDNSGPNANTTRDMSEARLDNPEAVKIAITWYNEVDSDTAGRFTPGDWIATGQKIADAATMVLGLRHYVENGRVCASADNDIELSNDTASITTNVTDKENPAGIKSGGKAVAKAAPKDRNMFADPENKVFPVDNQIKAEAAMRYYNAGNQQAIHGYTGDEWENIGNNIANAVTSYTGNEYQVANGNVVPVKGGKVNKMSQDLLNNAISVNNDNIDLTPKQKLGIFKQLASWLVGVDTEEITKSNTIEAEEVTVDETITKAEVAEDQTIETEGEEMDTETLKKAIAEALAEANLSKAVTEPISTAQGDTVGNHDKEGFSTERLQEFFGEFKDLSWKVEQLGKRLDDIEKATAGKKSVVDNGKTGPAASDDDEDDMPIKKSAKSSSSDAVWGNIFIPQGVIESLGYES